MSCGLRNGFVRSSRLCSDTAGLGNMLLTGAKALAADWSREMECESCRGRVQLKVFACAIQGECVLSGQGAGLVDCARCPQYECGEKQGACDA